MSYDRQQRKQGLLAQPWEGTVPCLSRASRIHRSLAPLPDHLAPSAQPGVKHPTPMPPVQVVQAAGLAGISDLSQGSYVNGTSICNTGSRLKRNSLDETDDCGPATASRLEQPLLLYAAAVKARPWSHDPKLHAHMLQLLLSLLISPHSRAPDHSKPHRLAAGGADRQTRETVAGQPLALPSVPLQPLQAGGPPSAHVGLDPAHVAAFPGESGIPYNAEHLLTWHFAAPPGAAVTRALATLLASTALQATSRKQAGRSSGAMPYSPMYVACAHEQASDSLRLLRLLSRRLLEHERYTDLKFHTRGAYGVVYRARRLLPATVVAATGSSDQGCGVVPAVSGDIGQSGLAMATPAECAPLPVANHSGVPAIHPQPPQYQQVVIKCIELPASEYERCVLPAVYGEVSILERYSLALHTPCEGEAAGGGCGRQPRVGHPGVCQLLDYGLAPTGYWLVMRRYACSLAEWRMRQPPATAQSPAALAMYLGVLQEVRQHMESVGLVVVCR
jgi:hypothetical protein